MITPLDPVIAEIIPLLPLSDPDTMTPQSARESLRALAAARAAVPPPPVHSVDDTEVKGAVTALAARVYQVFTKHRRPSCFSTAADGSPAISKRMTGRRGCSPSRPARSSSPSTTGVRRKRAFPARSTIAFAAVSDVIERVAEFGGDHVRVGVAGDSAGGDMAAAAAIACRDAGITRRAVAVYPVTDVAGNFADANENARFPSRAENAEGYFLSRAVMEWFAGQYLDDVGHGDDWRVSPLRAKSLAGLAPAIVCTAWFDPLRDEGKAYAEALQAAGVATKCHHGAGLIHGYFGLGEASETARLEAQRARADSRALLNGALI